MNDNKNHLQYFCVLWLLIEAAIISRRNFSKWLEFFSPYINYNHLFVISFKPFLVTLFRKLHRFLYYRLHFHFPVNITFYTKKNKSEEKTRKIKLSDSRWKWAKELADDWGMSLMWALISRVSICTLFSFKKKTATTHTHTRINTWTHTYTRKC